MFVLICYVDMVLLSTRLVMQDKRAKALLEQPAFHDGEAMKDAALALLAHVRPNDEVTLIGNDLLHSMVADIGIGSVAFHALLSCIALRLPCAPVHVTVSTVQSCTTAALKL